MRSAPSFEPDRRGRVIPAARERAAHAHLDRARVRHRARGEEPPILSEPTVLQCTDVACADTPVAGQSPVVVEVQPDNTDAPCCIFPSHPWYGYTGVVRRRPCRALPAWLAVRAHLVQRLVSALRQQTTARVQRQQRIDLRDLLRCRSVVTEKLGIKLSGVHSPSLVWGGSSRMIARNEGSSIRCVPAGIGIDDRLRGRQKSYRSKREFSFDSRSLQEYGRISGTCLRSR